jgi:tRNA G46 methylase TrmB
MQMAEQNPVVNGIEIDTEKVQRMLGKIIVREKTNLKTREKTDAQMVQMIKKMIEEEVECY